MGQRASLPPRTQGIAAAAGQHQATSQRDRFESTQKIRNARATWLQLIYRAKQYEVTPRIMNFASQHGGALSLSRTDVLLLSMRSDPLFSAPRTLVNLRKDALSKSGHARARGAHAPVGLGSGIFLRLMCTRKPGSSKQVAGSGEMQMPRATALARATVALERKRIATLARD